MPLRLSTHRAIELAVGLALAALPAVLLVAGVISDSIWAIAASMGLGLLVATLGASTDREGRGVEGSTHLAADRLIVVALLVAAVILGLAGQQVVALACAAAALVQGALTVSTRYSGGAGTRDRTRPTTVTSD
jgi:hypothetical protein